MKITSQATSEERVVTRQPCTLRAQCIIERGTRADWSLHFHYRSHETGPVKAIYRARYKPTGRTVGVIVYAGPVLQNGARNTATGNQYVAQAGDFSAMASKVNREIEVIRRIVVHPTFRGIGLGEALVRDTMPLRGKRFIESSTVMGAVNPFMERCMTGYDIPPSEVVAKLMGALRAFGVTDAEIASPTALMAKVESMQGVARALIEDALFRAAPANKRWTESKATGMTLVRACRWASANALMRPRYFLWSSSTWQGTPGVPTAPVPVPDPAAD